MSRHALPILLLTLGFTTAPLTSRGDEAEPLTGTWSWTWKDAQGVEHKHVLEVEGSGDKLAARETFDDLEPVKVTDLKFSDKKVSFTVRRDARRASYSGKLSKDDLLEGMVTVSSDGQSNEYGWEAKKMPAKKK